MENVKINISELKSIISRINLAVEKSKINPKSGWIELEETSSTNMRVKVGSFDYYLEAEVTITCDNFSEENKIHATITAETFIPLVSKLEEDYVEVSERLNTLVLTTKSSEYTFPIIKEMGKVRSVDKIDFNPTRCERYEINGNDIASIADQNAKGLVDSIFAKEIQQYVYVDNEGALTFTENIYINNFLKPVEVTDDHPPFRFLLTCTQAKMLDAFSAYPYVEVAVEHQEDYEETYKVMITSMPSRDISIVFITQSNQTTDRFPSVKLRQLASAVMHTHAVIDKKEFEKALARLMVFDKKFDITILNYSKLVFGKDSVKLVSTKNKNYEIVKYKEYENTTDHESIIRFADLTKQLKAIMSDKIDISYGDSPAIVINSGRLKQMIPEIRERV